MATKNTPLCPKLTSDQQLELRSLQLAEANMTNTINQARENIIKIQQGFYQKVSAFSKELGVDESRVEFNTQDLKFQLKPGHKGNR